MAPPTSTEPTPHLSAFPARPSGGLFRFLNLTDEEKAALVEAARSETLVSATQGVL